MVDSPVVIFAGRTAIEIGVPFVGGIALLVVARQPVLAALGPPLLFWALPILRQRFGRGRLFHMMWSRGWANSSDLPFRFGWNERTKTFGP